MFDFERWHDASIVSDTNRRENVQFLISIKYEFIKKSNSVYMKKVAEGLELEIRSSVI